MNTAISEDIRKRAIDKYSKAKNKDNFVSHDLSDDNDTSLVKAGSCGVRGVDVKKLRT